MGNKKDERTKHEQWNNRYEMGLLIIYIDDMDNPYMTTIVNMGEMVNTDVIYTEPEGVM